MLVLSVVELLTGCASSGEVKPNIWVSLTPAQRAEADVLERAMARIKQDCARRQGDACQSPPVTVTFDGAVPYYQQGTIVVSRAALIPQGRAVMAHELAHFWYADSRDCSKGLAVLCEWNANEHAVSLLVIGYGYDRATAVALMRATPCPAD